MMIAAIQETDLPRLAELYEELSGEASSLEAMAQTYRAIRDDIRYILRGIWSDGDLAGTVLGVVCAQLARDARPFMVLENLVVTDRHRRKGLGTRLLREMERMAVMCNCRSVVLVSSSRRGHAHAFYEAAGYGVDGVRGFRKIL